MFQHPLDHEHDVCTPGVVFVEYNRNRVAQSPRQNAFVEFCYLLAVTQFDRVLTDKVNSADMAVEVDPCCWPFQARSNLFDMGGFTCAVVALHHNATIVGKTRQDRERCVRVEFICAVDLWNAVTDFGKTLNSHISVNSKHIAYGNVFSWFYGRFSHSVHFLPLVPSRTRRRVQTQVQHITRACKGKGRGISSHKCLVCLSGT